VFASAISSPSIILSSTVPSKTLPSFGGKLTDSFSCNASFHKFCYGLAELPSEDFFCDVCLATNDPSSRKVSKGSSKNKKNASSSFLKSNR